MKRLVEILPGWLQELLPIFVGLSVGYFYFMAVIPAAREFGPRYLTAFAVIFVLTRIPRVWYYGRHLMPPLQRYKQARREGRRLGRGELEKTYSHLASFVQKSQILSAILWVMALVLLAVADQLWMVGSGLSFLGLFFGLLVVSSVSLTLTYFLVKERLRPLLEEVQGQMESPPRVDRWRVSFRMKMMGFVATLVTLAMLSFGLLLYALMYRSTEVMALSGGAQQIDEFSERILSAPPQAWEDIAQHHSSYTWGMFVVDAEGKGVAGCGPACHGGPDSRVGKAAKARLADLAAAVKRSQGRGRIDQSVQTEEGRVIVSDLPDGSVVATVLHPRALRDLMRPVLVGGALYLVITLSLLAAYIFLLGDDQSRVLSRMEAFSRNLAEGDLRADAAIWNDDELGRVADNLRGTYYGLRRMVGQAREAAAAVDREVEAAVMATSRLRQDALEQSRSTESSAQSVAAVAGGLRAVTRSMEAVSGATQDVSSTVLEMHASVEEIASNAETLSGSVEKSVSTTNEIAAASQQVSDSGQTLQESARESVAFFTELDAALEETRRNAEALLRSAEKVTADAEEGFSTVAAVEEEILRIRKAAESSRTASSRLRGSMDRIGAIVGVIQDVTEQTNLLALNASIIAAGAGEHGRAFGVVASQVRELSGRTAGHAAEIRSVIRSLLESGREMTEAIDRTEQVVGASADLSRSAGEALRTILESASSQEDMSRRIAAATEELAHGGQASSRNFQQIFEMAEGIGKATAEQAQATRFLHQESERVRSVAHMLKNATQEQARGARLISEAVGRITEDSGAVTQAVLSQGEEAASMDESVRRLAGSARGIGKVVEDLAAANERLQRASEALGSEIRKFEL